MGALMQSNLTGDDLFSYILMLQSGPTAKMYVLCEGESDCAILDPHIKESICETIPGYGKSSVLEAITIADQQNKSGVAALVDRDWEKEASSLPGSAVVTDHYDIDATVFYTGDVCRRVVTAFCDRTLVRDFLRGGGWNSPSEVATSLAFPVGVLRKLNHEEGWGLRFSDTPFSEVALQDSTGIDLTKAVGSALSRSRKPRIAERDIAAIAALAQHAMAGIADRRAYCCGHDLNSALAYLMSNKWSARINRKILERAMRATVSCADISSTEMFSGIPSALKTSPGELYTCS
ncbi:hypothetical protein ACFWM7_18385 [Streptomyces sp. NPDC058375]|uniref:hypothetical protein n=1 Tax=Streptomyces sp. NPDC058375 TaxID=3346467 RepID=UPI00365292F2